MVAIFVKLGNHGWQQLRPFLYRLLEQSAYVLFAAASLSNSSLADTSSYHIGNSLTWDSQPDGIAALANANGKNHVVGYHIRLTSR
jgi:hypothetical protein